jgi:hypothetical protein
VKSRRSSASVAAASLAVVLTLSACGASAPPARELADEMIDTLDVDDDVKDCMHQQVEDFRLSDEDAQGFNDLDDVAAKAAEGQERAIQIMDDFENALASCNGR